MDPLFAAIDNSRIFGYYPFGKELFSDLTHYVRSGDFVLALLREKIRTL